MRTALKWVLACFCLLLAAAAGCKAPEQSDNTTVVTSSCQLIRLLNAQDWPESGLPKPSITGNIHIKGTVTLMSYFLNKSEITKENEAEFRCFCPLGFSNRHGGDGITIADLVDSGEYTQTMLTLKDVKLRFRKMLEDGHPGPCVFSTILLMPPTEQPCNADELRCAEDQVCYPWNSSSYLPWDSYCLACDEYTYEECLCRYSNGTPYDNGTFCDYWASADNGVGGVCSGGVCIPN